ncbi:unnamed protein product [Blepharisma stoltei]|uniref:Uncharacterized protein n=1 Tax=Blepharisma stoltei TaxID=1481888 RepID=A0AAU9JF56_9CILI|nr:unnamed protein product [Blepharisma stoltei]
MRWDQNRTHQKRKPACEWRRSLKRWNQAISSFRQSGLRACRKNRFTWWKTQRRRHQHENGIRVTTKLFGNRNRSEAKKWRV